MDDDEITGGNVEGLPAADSELQAELAQLGIEAGAQSTEEITQAAALATTSEADYRELLTQLLGPAFAVMAPGWGVLNQEIEALAAAYSPLLVKYFPEGPERFGPEISALLVTSMIIIPRLKMPRQLEPAPVGSKQTVKKAANDDAPVSLDAMGEAA